MSEQSVGHPPEASHSRGVILLIAKDELGQAPPELGWILMRSFFEALARISHQVATATAHLRTLARDFGVRLLDVPRGTPPGPNPEISRQSTNLHRLTTRPGEICGLAVSVTKPERAIFVNTGVRLTTEGSEVLDDVRALESTGVQILSCVTCLDYLGLADKLEVGRATNMNDTVDALMTAGHVVSL